MSDDSYDEEYEQPIDELFTQRHRDNLDKVIEIMDATFDSYVVTYKVLSNDAKKDQCRTAFSGGRAEAIGLIEMAKYELVRFPPQ